LLINLTQILLLNKDLIQHEIKKDCKMKKADTDIQISDVI